MGPGDPPGVFFNHGLRFVSPARLFFQPEHLQKRTDDKNQKKHPSEPFQSLYLGVQNNNFYTGSNSIPRQIDYILTTKPFFKTIRDCESNTDIDMGSDHQCLHTKSTITRTP